LLLVILFWWRKKTIMMLSATIGLQFMTITINDRSKRSIDKRDYGQRIGSNKLRSWRAGQPPCQLDIQNSYNFHLHHFHHLPLTTITADPLCSPHSPLGTTSNGSNYRHNVRYRHG